jgi:hypothetical protein
VGDAIGLVIAGVGTGISAIGQYKQGQATKSIANLNATTLEQTGELNASLIEEGTKTNVEALTWDASMADAQATDAVARGKEQETVFRQGIRRMIGGQRASFGASGVEVGTGSAADVQADTAYWGEIDALTIRTNAAREAWGYQVTAADYRRQATSTRRLGALEAKNTRAVARANALSARLGGTYAAQSATTGAAATIAAGAGTLLLDRYKYGSKYVPAATTTRGG